jgi:transcriptional regulator with XRE-family HTH domain
MTDFGAQLRKFRQKCHDPAGRQGKLTQQKLGELLREEVGIRYSAAAVSDWERGKSRINKDDRPVLVALIRLFYKYGGLKSAEEADRFLETGNYRALDAQEKQRLFPVSEQDDPNWQRSSKQGTSRLFISGLLRRLFSLSDEELQNLTDYTQNGPPPSWPRVLAALMRRASDRIYLSPRFVLWIGLWWLAWWLMAPSLRWPFANRAIALQAVGMYVVGTLVVPLLMGALIETRQNEYWQSQGVANSRMLRLYTYQGAGIGFNLGYFFVLPLVLIQYFLGLESSRWLAFLAVTLGLIVGNMSARVVPHNLWLAYHRLHLADGALFFVVALVGPLWGLFFLEYYSVLLTPFWGGMVILAALLLSMLIPVGASKRKVDSKQAQP